MPGMLDALFHCFERAGVVADDMLFQEVLWTQQGYDKENPRAEIEIKRRD